MSNEQAPPKLRSDVVADMVAEIIQGLGEAGCTPAEAMTTGEVLLWALFERLLEPTKTLPPEMQQQAKLLCSRVLNRLASRVEAWPAKTHDRN